MAQTIRERRLSLGWSQRELAAFAHIPRPSLARIEAGLAGANPDYLSRLAAAFQCSEAELEVAPARPRGRQKVQERELLERFRQIPSYTPEGQPARTRLHAARSSYPDLMRRLDRALEEEEAWRRHLDRAPADSGLESLVMLLELERGARPVMASPLQVGFDLFPVTERERPRLVGHCPVPALIRPEWLWIHQVTVRTPWRYRVDGLLLVLEPYRRFCHLEIDGRGHDPRWDKDRAERLKIVRIRLTEEDLLAGVSLTDRLSFPTCPLW